MPADLSVQKQKNGLKQLRRRFTDVNSKLHYQLTKSDAETTTADEPSS